MTRRAGAVALALALLTSACGLDDRGPWVDRFGRELQGSEMVEFRGFAACEWQDVVFIRFFGDQYARDPGGVLGVLVSTETGGELAFDVLPELPPGLEGTDITHDGREVFIGDDRADYLYIRLPNGEVERWPRAEIECE